MMAVLFFVTAILYSAVGHAGGSGYLASMALVGVMPATMKPTALVLNVLVATIALLRFARAGHFSYRSFWPFALGSVPFAFLGGALSIPGHWYKILVGFVLLVAAARLLWERRRDVVAQRRARRPVMVGCGAIIGLLAGLTGTGGGIFLSPLLLFTGWAETRETGGLSAAFILANSIAGLAGNPASLQHLSQEIPMWASVVVVGGIIGSELGSRRIGTPAFRTLLALVLIVASLKLILT